jgi:4-hydroxybenzoyl-CoA reductase subunit beta
MLILRPFSLEKPTNILDLKQCLANADSKTRIIAGGTDLIPNLKNGLYDINKLISLKKLSELRNLDNKDNNIRIGALISLSEIENNKIIRTKLPALSYAASQIASPQIRNMATVGGNICLDTRCLYFNQSEFWRKALGYCLKKDGDICHVTKTGKRCVAASSNDLATLLLAYEAKINIISHDSEREILLSDFYTNNGEKNNILKANEIVSTVTFTFQEGSYSAFAKLRHRASIDFSMLSLGLVFKLSQGLLHSGNVVLSALVARPRLFNLSAYNGACFNEELVLKIGEDIAEKSHPQSNICDDPQWRKDMIVELVKEAFNNAKKVG